MATTDALKAAWETEIAKISDTLLNAKATYILDTYVAALESQALMAANDITSYTIAGRTVTRRDGAIAQSMIDNLENQLTDLTYGTVSLIDANTGVAQP